MTAGEEDCRRRIPCSRSARTSRRHSWIELSERRRRERAQDEKVSLHGTDLRRSFARGRIAARHRRFHDAKSQSRGTDRQVVVQLVPDEDIAQRLHARIREQSPAVRAKAVRRIGVARARSKADQRRVQESYADAATEWRVDSLPAPNVS